MNGSEHISWRMLVYYGLPGFALAMPTIPVYVYLPSFYADDLGLGLAATGGVLLAARTTDVVTDPLVGYASDRWRSRWGRRKPWILVGAVLAAVALLLLFQPPSAVGRGYLLGAAIVLYLGWTLVAVPYSAWGAELSTNYHERSRITGSREGLMLIGVLAAGGVPAIATALGGEERDGLAAIAWLAIIAGTPAIALLLSRVPEPESSASMASVVNRKAVVAILTNGPFARLLAAWFVNGFANGIPAALFPLYLQYGLQADSTQRGILIFVYFLCGVAAVPFWILLSRRFGKHRIWCGAMALACLSFVWVPFIPTGAIAPFLVICILTGMALGADLALPPAMQADVIDLDTLRTGQRRAGLFFALWSMATKLALAGAVGVALPALEVFGFEPGVTNGREVVLALAVIYAVVPTVLKVGAIALVWRYPITEKRQSTIRRRLAAIEARSGQKESTGTVEA